jgi:hypothetical protein
MRRLTKVDGTGFFTYHLDGVGVKSRSAMVILSCWFSDSTSFNQEKKMQVIQSLATFQMF